MMIHDTVDGERGIRLGELSSNDPHRSPARQFAEAIWYAIWHAGAATFAGGRWVLLADAIRRERAVLATLDAAALADIGLDASAARAESTRHWTDLPACRRH